MTKQIELFKGNEWGSAGALRVAAKRRAVLRRAAAGCLWALAVFAAPARAEETADPLAPAAPAPAAPDVELPAKANDPADADAPGAPVAPLPSSTPASVSTAVRPGTPGSSLTVPGTLPPYVSTAQVITEAPTNNSKLSLLVNKSLLLATKNPYKRVSVGQPEVADVNILDQGSILLTGKKPGVTQLIVWSDGDKATVLDVAVTIDTAGMQDQIRNLFPNLKLDVRSINGTVAIRGHVPSLAVADQVLQVAKPYARDVLDLMEISGGQQVMLQVRFAEVSRTATSALGVNLGLTDTKSFGGSNVGQVSPFSTTGSGPGAELAIPGPGAAVTLFGKGMLGKTTFASFVEALRQNNLMRVLAEPNVMAISGQEASFIAGGEFPIPVAQGGPNSGAISIEFREYGVKLKFVPVVLGDGRIRLKVSPEVSDLDYANGVTQGGFRIPAVTQRKVSTTVELVDGQTFAVAGLLSNSVTAGKDVTPGLGDLPVIGALFRSVRYLRKETELVVLVTPRLVEPMNPTDVPVLPGEFWRHPTESELFYTQFLGAAGPDPRRPAATQPPADRKSAPRFRGQYGFVPAGEIAPRGTVASGRD